MPIRIDAVEPRTVALIGVPWDVNSSLVRGTAAAPAAIRSALFDPQRNLSIESGRNLYGERRLVDAGDLLLDQKTAEAQFDAIVTGVGAFVERDARVLALGGDHAISYPLVKAHAAHHPPLNVVQIDAHPDLYVDFEGNRFSHASGFYRIMHEGLAERLVQIGIRAATPHQREQAERYGVQMLFPDDPASADHLPAGPTYLSVDMDGLDPAFAPGVAHPEAGGLSTREVIRIVHSLPGPLVGADIVELNPSYDVRGVTALVAAKLAKEIVGRLLDDRPVEPEGAAGQ